MNSCKHKFDHLKWISWNKAKPGLRHKYTIQENPWRKKIESKRGPARLRETNIWLALSSDHVYFTLHKAAVWYLSEIATSHPMPAHYLGVSLVQFPCVKVFLKENFSIDKYKKKDMKQGNCVTSCEDTKTLRSNWWHLCRRHHKNVTKKNHQHFSNFNILLSYFD